MQILSELLAEMGAEFFDDACFCCGREAIDGRYRLTLLPCKLPNEAGGIQIVRPKIVPPFGQTMGFVKHPTADFTLLENIAHADAAQLFRGEVQNSGVPQSDAIEDLSANTEIFLDCAYYARRICIS